MATATSDPWTMTRPEPKGDGSGYKYELIPADNYPGCMVGLFHVGQHYQEETDKKTGEKRRVLKHKLILVYEINEARSDGRPHLIAEKVTHSLNEKATFLARAAAMLARDIAVGETIDPRELLGRPCMVDVVNTAPKKNAQGVEKVYHQLKGIAKLPKGMPPHQCRTPTVAWSVVDGRPFPEGDWPYVYGQSIADIAGESVEAGEAKAVEVRARAEEMARQRGESVVEQDAMGTAPF